MHTQAKIVVKDRDPFNNNYYQPKKKYEYEPTRMWCARLRRMMQIKQNFKQE